MQPTRQLTSTDPHVRQLPVQVQEKIREIELRVTPRGTASLLWDQVFTEHERARLGGDFGAAWRQFGGPGMWQHIHGVSKVRAILEVAHELSLLADHEYRCLLRETREWSDDPEELVQIAAQLAALVLCARPRTVVWNAMPIEIDWVRHNSVWAYFWELCRHAKRGHAIDRLIFSRAYDPNHLVKMKSRLSGMEGFPAALADHIVSAGRGTQRLDLPPQQIRLFEPASIDTVREITD